MMYKLDPQALSVLNAAIQEERKAELFYTAARDFTKNVGFFNSADFFANESEDEKAHAKKIRDFITDWNDIPQNMKLPEFGTFESLKDVFESAYEMEYGLCELYKGWAIQMFAVDQNVYKFLQHFIKIQNKAVAEYSDFMNQLVMINTPFEELWFDQNIMKSKI
ncbi:hypothetical protein EBU94_08635 [bacterium]|nr:hypothetical protein [bacterium]